MNHLNFIWTSYEEQNSFYDAICKCISPLRKLQFCRVHLFSHVSSKRTITFKCYFVKTRNKDFFIPYRWVVLLSYTILQSWGLNALLVTGFHKTYVILKKAKWPHFWRSWDMLLTKAAIPTIFYHSSYFYKGFHLVLLPYRYTF